jgi:hypothetical protein
MFPVLKPKKKKASLQDPNLSTHYTFLTNFPTLSASASQGGGRMDTFYKQNGEKLDTALRDPYFESEEFLDGCLPQRLLLSCMRFATVITRAVIANVAHLFAQPVIYCMDLRGTGVSDRLPLSGLTGLNDLPLYATPVTDLSPLPGVWRAQHNNQILAKYTPE